MSLRQKIFDRLINIYPPYLGAGIKVSRIAPDHRSCRVEMGLSFYNRNYVGTQFGGSLYSMVDPWYMLMLMKNLGKGYIVWDKAATIRFKKPGKGKVVADFVINETDINDILDTLKTAPKMDKVFTVIIKDMEGNTVAEVDKTIYIKKK
ncbi:MAG: DUF4442 domain-containing protein [Bacteriovoracaceae bacterium]